MEDLQKEKKRKHDDLDAVEEKHLNWTALQGSCLTGGGQAESLYTAERGFPFTESELPHFHLQRGDTHQVFSEWKSTQPPVDLVAGAWYRPLFCGGWNHTTESDERVFNLQSHNLFVDLRIPRSREQVLTVKTNAKSLKDLTPHQLRLYARQHVFAGFSVCGTENGSPLCTRHHCIDWNYVGQGRSRPNKWWIQLHVDSNQWKEFSYAKDDMGQYYYFERWQRLPLDGAKERRVALRKSSTEDRDGVFVLIGDHFNYVLNRELTGDEKDYGQATLVGLVDAAVNANDLDTARSYLSIEAGHGTVSSGWKLDCAIPPWREGANFLLNRGSVQVQGNSTILWGSESWDVMDNSFETLEQLASFLTTL